MFWLVAYLLFCISLTIYLIVDVKQWDKQVTVRDFGFCILSGFFPGYNVFVVLYIIWDVLSNKNFWYKKLF